VGQVGGGVGDGVNPGGLPGRKQAAGVGQVGRAVAGVAVQVGLVAAEERRVLAVPAARRRVVVAAQDAVIQARSGVPLPADPAVAAQVGGIPGEQVAEGVEGEGANGWA